MTPQAFKQRQNEAMAEGWELSFIGQTDVDDETSVMGGLQLAVLGRKRKTRVIAADMNPDSSAVSDHVVQWTRSNYGSVCFIDALPINVFSQFQGRAFSEELADHVQRVQSAGNARVRAGDMMMDNGLVAHAISLTIEDNNNTARIGVYDDGPTVIQDPSLA